jgi:TonB family protein
MSYIKLWKTFRKGELRSFREILGDQALMLAALFSVTLHASLFLFLKDWPHLADPPRRVPAIMVARLLKSPVETSVAVPQEVTGTEDGMGTGEERSEAGEELLPERSSEALPDREEAESILPGFAAASEASASMAVRSRAARGAAEGRLHLDGPAVVKAKPAAPPASRLSRRGVTVQVGIAASTLAVRRDRNIRAAILEIRKRIESKKIYPLRARRRGGEGEVLVEIVLGGAGQLDSLRLLRQSGFPLLDRATLTAVRAAVPFPPVQGRVKIPVSYRLIPD